MLTLSRKPRLAIIPVMRVEDFDRLMHEWLSLDDFKGTDNSLNGLQVGKPGRDIRRAAFAVDACLESFKRAAEWKADLLFVHHGLFWGKDTALTGAHYRRIKELLENDLALYAAHLPLDAHPELGNNAGIAELIGLRNLEPFGLYKGVKIGYKGVFAEEKSLDEVAELLCGGKRNCLGVLPFGPDTIKSAGIVSGGAAEEVLDAIAESLDLYITGDSSHSYYHQSLESRINVIFGGHYITEIWGVKRLAEKLKKSTEIETIFLDIPTGL